MNSCNECVSTLDDTPTILIREINCWESIHAQVTVLSHCKEGSVIFLRRTNGLIYPLGIILRYQCLSAVNTVSLNALYSTCGATLSLAFPVEDRESVRNRATTTTVGYRSTIGKNATWHAAWIFPLHRLQQEQRQRSGWMNWQIIIDPFCNIVIS